MLALAMLVASKPRDLYNVQGLLVSELYLAENIERVFAVFETKEETQIHEVYQEETDTISGKVTELYAAT